MKLNFDPNSDRIKLAHKRLIDAYNRVPGAEVPVVEPSVGTPCMEAAKAVAEGNYEVMLQNAIAWANGLAATDNDWPPFIDTFCGVVLVAEAFGCPITHGEGDVAWTKPAISDISQVDTLKPMKLNAVPFVKRLTEYVDYAQRTIGTELPMWTMDIQSPFSVAAHVIDSTELLMACITDPPRVHKLCQMITDFTIEMTQQHLDQMEHPGYPGRNFPSISENIGICIADDTPLIMLSPDMYREFSLPYNSQIGEAFGGVHIHSCGDYRHNLDCLQEITHIRSIQAHAGPGEFILPDSPEEDCAFNRARKKLTYLIDTNDVARADKYRNRPKDHYEQYVLPRLRDDVTGLILQSCGFGQGLDDANAAIKWTREQISRVR